LTRRVIIDISGQFQHAFDRLYVFRPAFLELREMLTARFRNAVVPRPTIVVGGAPLGTHPPCFVHSMQRWIERALLDMEHIRRNLLNAIRDGIAVKAVARREYPQHEKVERSLKLVFLCYSHSCLWGVCACHTAVSIDLNRDFDGNHPSGAGSNLQMRGMQ
jgi:hypothetical protein